MSALLYQICILLPTVAGLVILSASFRSFRVLKWITLPAVFLTSLAILLVLLEKEPQAFVLWRFSGTLSLAFRADGLSRFFLGILAALWPMTAVYACSYMKSKQHLPLFFGFFCISYGMTAGIALADNLFTMYVFYELLSLSTVGLVLQPFTKGAVSAAKTYLVYMLGGAAFGFAAMLFLLVNGAGISFTPGGSLLSHPGNPDITFLFYLFGFFGFGVKAAVFPFYAWLPKASVAPTPVTALLHAVAVVKAGAFAIMRLTYYCFSPALLSGSWAQHVAMLFAAFTIFFGASKAVKELHFKRRLVFSTVANLSYILFALTLMTPAGLTAGLLHMAAHACIKILAFFCAGSALEHSGAVLLKDLDGLGKKMPVTFACFTCAALSLTGIPPFNGFVSKWYILTAAAKEGSSFAYVGAGLLIVAALLTAIYMLSAVRRAWFPEKGFQNSILSSAHEADPYMLVPMILLAVATLVLGIFSQDILSAAESIAMEVTGTL